MNTWRKNENDSSFGMLQHKNNIPVLQYSNTPLLRSPEFEDENEALGKEKRMFSSTIPGPP